MPPVPSCLLRLALFSVVLVSACPLCAKTLVESGVKAKSVWRYLDTGAEPPADWRRGDFNDTAWKTGLAPLGFGYGEVKSPIDFGGKPQAKHITTYFRRGFDVPEATDSGQLLILLRVDDAAVIYLNGTELIRDNLSAGPVAASTRATRAIGPIDQVGYHRYIVPATALVAGRNTLAVEVHQCSADSSDLFLDLELKTHAPAEDPSVARVPPPAREVTLLYLKRHYLPARTTIPDGYVDGGRSMKIADDGTVQSPREVLVVDRSRDPGLRQHLAYAHSPGLEGLPPVERARLLAAYVDRESSPAEGRGLSLQACRLVEGEFRGREMLLGTSLNSGVCRHRAVLFKLLADEAGLAVTLARGNLGHANSSGGHVWNELLLDDGRKFIVDVMNPRPGFGFPATTDRLARDYLTVDNKPYYPESRAAKD